MSFTHSIMFHHFHDENHLPAQGSLSAEDFQEMLEWLASRYRILDAGQYIAGLEANCLEPTDICLSFDDALLCQFDVAVPVMDRLGIRAFFFVYSSVFGGEPEPLEIFRLFRTSSFDNVDAFYGKFFDTVREQGRENYLSARSNFEKLDYLASFPFYTENDKWFRYLRDQVLGDTAYKEIMLGLMQKEAFNVEEASKLLWMTEENLRQLHNSGHVIGLHSYSHPTQMSRLSRKQQEHEYGRNMQHLEEVLGTGEVLSMSHPCGDYNSDTLDVLSQLGIKIGFRSSLSRTEIRSSLEVPREDHANIYRKMKNENHAL